MNIIKAIGTEGAKQPLSVMAINRRDLLADDIEIQILYCGICHSDLHQIHNDFGGSHFPMVPGHEIVGQVTAVGSAVTDFKSDTMRLSAVLSIPVVIALRVSATYSSFASTVPRYRLTRPTNILAV
ncbi:alcohol dehydrogenase catalytic domain-containing protein [Shewanella sp.]|uniref:alcohol dehydrogenase catalytic domain-containing protein n=1 Tax=Shewanella sp. TaxID=50422 RepID=UPI003A97B5FB